MHYVVRCAICDDAMQISAIEQIENGTRSLTQSPGVSESYKVHQRVPGPVVELRATP